MPSDQEQNHTQDHEGHVHSNMRLEEIQEQLQEIFQKLSHPVPLSLFTNDDTKSPFNQAAREILQTISKISPNVPVHEYSLQDQEAKQRGIDRSPTILFDPDKYGLDRI